MNDVRKKGNNIRSYAQHRSAAQKSAEYENTGHRNTGRGWAEHGSAGRGDARAEAYLSDEALQELIAATEAEPMMRPPKGFRDEVLARVRRKRQRVRNMSLFSYSMKVIAATAAAVSIVLIVPENIRPDQNGGTGMRTEWQKEEILDKTVLEDERSERGDFLNRFSNRLDGFCSALNGRLNQLVGTEGHD